MNQKYLKERLDYDPETGVFIWKPISVNEPRHKAWNTKFAGKRAGTVKNEHRQIQIDGEFYSATRLVWLFIYGYWPSGLIYHFDGDKDNNSLENLEQITEILKCR
jgi:hypothetical protein